MAFIILFFIQESKFDKIILLTSDNSEFQEVTLKAILLTHNQTTYDWIGSISLAFFILNMTFFRFWVKSKKWISEPILILIISYLVTFSFYTYRSFEIRDNLFEEKTKAITAIAKTSFLPVHFSLIINLRGEKLEHLEGALQPRW
jgi:hypothetical protein